MNCIIFDFNSNPVAGFKTRLVTARSKRCDRFAKPPVTYDLTVWCHQGPGVGMFFDRRLNQGK